MLHIYNTLTKKKEPFQPLNSNLVKIYVCGPTVYDKTHIGHAKTYVAFDVIRRYLEFLGYNIFYIVNITDIEDKIIMKSLKTGKKWNEVADEYIKDFFKATDKLNIKRAHIYPRVSEHIEDIIKFIEKLIEKGYAYEAEGNVYFSVDSFNDYGKLSNITKEQLKTFEEGFGKRKPYDFALWKKAKPNEPYWESPWGPGRPGWHIECSVMSSKYLGSQFDIHGGGEDLIFPHHENEIAQSEAHFGVKPWVKYWMHTGMLIVGKDKMSKSIGNIVTVEELISKYDPMEIRYYLISGHYRSQLSFSEEALKHAKAAYKRILNAISNLNQLKQELTEKYKATNRTLKTFHKIIEIRNSLIQAMNDDFNTPVALAKLHEITSLVNKEILKSPEPLTVLTALRVYEEASEIFGLFEKEFRKTEGREEKLVASLINLILSIRQEYRRKREWKTADWIASELRKIGIELSDMKDKTLWRIKL